MNIKQHNFVLSLENPNSSILITVPHGGLPNRYGSWLETLFKKRTEPSLSQNEHPSGEKTIIDGDPQIWHVVADIINKYPANAVMGLLPRSYVDYNRFTPSVAYSDEKLAPFYYFYHHAIETIIKRLSAERKKVILLDLHGFNPRLSENKNFDIILGTNHGLSSPRRIDELIYQALKDKYQIYCHGQTELSQKNELYQGETTNLHYHKEFGLDAVLIEISPKFRSADMLGSKENGLRLANDFALVLEELTKD